MPGPVRATRPLTTLRAVKIAPAYDGSTRLVMDVGVAGVGAALTRQRRRFDAMVRGLDAAQWSHPSRCAEWTVRDVVAHLVGVNRFWAISVRSGVAGAPTRFLEHFDPAAVPRQMVAAMRDLGIDDLLAQHAAANAELLDAIAQLGPDDWEALAESPAGHVPVWSVAHHALWDCWVHERDIALPLGLAVPGEPDELAACLRYCAGIGAVLTLGSRAESAAVYGIVATEPDLALRIDVDD